MFDMSPPSTRRIARSIWILLGGFGTLGNFPSSLMIYRLIWHRPENSANAIRTVVRSSRDQTTIECCHDYPTVELSPTWVINVEVREKTKWGNLFFI